MKKQAIVLNEYKEKEGELIRGILYSLRMLGCPSIIINQLEEWQKEPVINIQKLQQWVEFCRK